VFLAKGLAPRLDTARPRQGDGQVRTRVSRGESPLVLEEASVEILGDARVERAVAAAQDVDESAQFFGAK
jgi:hypothetical protein